MIKLSASLSKKVPLPDVEYSSRSCAAGIEVEVPSGTPPEEIRKELSRLYLLLEASVDEQLQETPEQARGKRARPSEAHKVVSRGNGNGRKATEAQVKAIHAIARDREIADAVLNVMLQEDYGAESAEKLTIRDASSLIDRLKNGKEQ